MDLKGFGGRLRVALKESGVTGAALGQRLSEYGADPVSRQLVSNWINGHERPNVEQLFAIFQILDQSADHLLFNMERRPIKAALAAARKLVNNLPLADKQILAKELASAQ